VISSRWTALSAAKHRLNFVDYAVLLLQESCDMGTLDSVAFLTVKSYRTAGQQQYRTAGQQSYRTAGQQ
jgi:hypothetical protein